MSSAFAVTLHDALGTVHSVANRVPVSAELTGTATVSGTVSLGAGTAFAGRLGKLLVQATASLTPSGTLLAWPAGSCFAAATPALMTLDFTSTYASRTVALVGLRVAVTGAAANPLSVRLLLANASFTAAADGQAPAATGLQALTLLSLPAAPSVHTAAFALAEAEAAAGARVAVLDASGRLYGQLVLDQDFGVLSASSLAVQVVLTARIL